MDLTGEIVFMRNRICAAALAAAVSICMVFSAGAAQGYEQPAVSFLPDVTQEMTSPDYWLKDDPQADAVLADYRQIQALNQAMVQSAGRPKAEIISDYINEPDGIEDMMPWSEFMMEQCHKADQKEKEMEPVKRK